MAVAITRIGVDDLDDVAAILNQSSKGRVFEFRVNALDVLSLAGFWNFSWTHSYLARVNGAAAAAVLNSVDAEAGEAYSFYWGAIPGRSSGPVSIRLATRFLNQVASEGYRTSYADISEGSPESIYERFGYRFRERLVQMECSEATASQLVAGLRDITCEELPAPGPEFVTEHRHWCARERTLRSMSRFLQCRASFSNHCMEAAAACSARANGTVLMSLLFRRDRPESVERLIAGLLASSLPRPLICSFVRPGGVIHSALSRAGFRETRSYSCLELDLAEWRANRLCCRG
jgi:hypothetical protein